MSKHPIETKDIVSLFIRFILFFSYSNHCCRSGVTHVFILYGSQIHSIGRSCYFGKVFLQMAIQQCVDETIKVLYNIRCTHLVEHSNQPMKYFEWVKIILLIFEKMSEIQGIMISNYKEGNSIKCYNFLKHTQE